MKKKSRYIYNQKVMQSYANHHMDHSDIDYSELM